MESPYWLYIVFLSLEASRISVTSYTGDGPSTLAILKYFHSPNDDLYAYGMTEDCSDPCLLNATFLSKRREEMERKCCNRHLPKCTEEQINSPYRNINGSCNNLCNPDWGMAGICHRRFLPHDYGDGLSYPRRSCLKEDLPNARAVSNVVHTATDAKVQADMTLYTMEWGQVIGHDASHASLYPVPVIGPGSCCDPHPRIDEECIAVVVPYNDRFYPGKGTCLAYQRTLKFPLCKGGVVQSLNSDTSYLDLSLVYGSSEEQLKAVRSYKNGMLRTQKIRGVGELLPPVAEAVECKSFNSTHQCFLSGDGRVNENLLLSSCQTILLRNHNKICRQLMKVNSHWDDDRLFHEARRINIAQAQMITFGKYLRRVIGPGIIMDTAFQLDVLPGKKFTSYDESVQATTYNEFAAAAHRYGHTQIPNVFFEKDPVHGWSRNIHVKDNFYWPFDFYSGQFDRLSLGMAIAHPKHRSTTLNFEVRNYLYELRWEKQFKGQDLGALSIVRGRENGIPGYTHYLKNFFGYNACSFCDLKGWIPGKTIEKLRKIYKSVHDVDLYTGILAEYHVDGGIIGPTGAAILATQYRNLKFGDRYYFEHRRVAGSFTPDQLAEIKDKTSLAKMICSTSKVSRIQPDVFFPASKRNRPVRCEEIPEMNFSLWKELF